MGQTPAIIVDSSAFNTSGPWMTVDDFSTYKNASIELSNPSATNTGMVGNISVKIGLEITSLQWMLMGNNLQPLNCTLQLMNTGFTEPMFPPLTSDSIFDNIIWDPAIILLELESNETQPVGVDFTIDCSKIGSTTLDYALLIPVPTMSLDNQLLFVNYTDSTLVLEGQWQDSMPEGGPGKTSVITGDTIKFAFTGWNITLLGYFNPNTSGNITLGVSLDEQTQVQLDFKGEVAGVSSSYFEYFTLVQQKSDSGNHTITIEVLEVSLSQIIGFRGFTYIPGFATLNDMPDLSVSVSFQPSPASTSSTHSTSSTLFTSPSISSPVGPVLSSHQGLHGGVIAGVVIGVISGICLILWVAWWQAKRRGSLSKAQLQMKSTAASEVPLPPGPDSVTPFEKRYVSDTPPYMNHIIAANAHGIIPFTKTYITASAVPGIDCGDTGQDQQGSTVMLPQGEGTVHLPLVPVEPTSNGNNGLNGDQTMQQPRLEPDRTELLLEQLNNLMNAIQSPLHMDKNCSLKQKIIGLLEDSGGTSEDLPPPRFCFL
ncbi:hypothetical protein BDP27DRAFT_1428346 [Rhodocollybia butyracea]|uniref:Peptidase A1 domain-containing protein n=1 Tax=Rhodocollybia butyracea TaxID=206335 RepID=A0A9P5U167_9AGAR|nr:hypothetical protein BDP27DRAFT_1428346 [Rhodocollybia butyracea]